ncbi:MAG: SHOCT domain-containing protein [Haloarculaceae archaeon]
MATERTTDGIGRIVLVVLAIVVLAPMLMMVFAFPMMGAWGGMMGGYGGYGGYNYSPWWGIAMLVVWLVVLGGGGYLLYRWLGQSGGVGTDPAMRELRTAYARGDLTDEEFEERRARLERE